MDKNSSMIEFLQLCPTIKANPMFFNFGNIENNASQLIPSSSDTITNEKYIDGSERKSFTFNVDIFKSVSYNAIVNINGYTDENVSDLAEVQEVIDWIKTQADEQIYPDFGDLRTVDEMTILTEEPKLQGLDSSTNPPIAIYRISVKIDYIDKSKMIN